MSINAATTSQNRQNAQHSTGPATPEGKAKSSRNAVKFGLFTAEAFVLPEERARFDALCESFREDFMPSGPLEEALTLEIIRATWRLERCGKLESALVDDLLEGTIDDETLARRQTSIDRARNMSLNIVKRSTAQLRQLQTDRQTRSALHFKEIHRPGIADFAPVLRALHTREKTAVAYGRSYLTHVNQLLEKEIAEYPANDDLPAAA